MPYTKNNFLQLKEWCTLKQLNNKGFMPTGEPFKLAPTAYRLNGVNYYSPYEIRTMTEEEIKAYNENRKVKVKIPKKPFGTLLDKLKNYYYSIKVEDSQIYESVIIRQKIVPFSRRCYSNSEIAVQFFDENNKIIYKCNLTTICTRITRGVHPYIFSDYYEPTISIEDMECIKSIIDINEIKNRDALIKIKQILVNTKSLYMDILEDRYKFKYIDFTDLR